MEQSLTPLYIVAYFFFAALVAVQGGDRRCGWFMALVCALFFSPIGGMFVVLTSKDKQTYELEQEQLRYYKKKNRGE